MKIIHTDKAPAAIGPYSQAIAEGGFIYTSGQIPIDPHSGVIESAGIEEQTEQALQNLRAVLEAAGSDLSHVVKTTCFLQRISDFAAFNAVYEKHFPGKPARSCIEVSALPKGALVEIEAVAFESEK
ncbi:MAG: RidA family protein [Clostridia bacterium]|nr:RidA family protein [Clostridia bacterium]